MPLLGSYDLLDATLEIFEDNEVALWTPSQLTNVEVWLKADALTGLNDGDAVSTFTDATVNGRNATSTGTNRPLYKTAIQNSLPVVRFDGSNDYLDMGSSIGLSAQPFMICGVWKHTTDATRLLTGKSSQIAISREATNSFQLYAGSFKEYKAGANSSFHVHACYFNAASSYGNYDGTQTTMTSPGTGAPTNGAMIGTNNIATANFINGDLAELIVISSTIGNDNLTKIEGYLAWKWGLQANLPGGHAYASAAPTLPGGKTGLRYAISGGLRQRTLP